VVRKRGGAWSGEFCITPEGLPPSFPPGGSAFLRCIKGRGERGKKKGEFSSHSEGKKLKGFAAKERKTKEIHLAQPEKR